ncbi:unnamed protein product, partial [Musa acuminata var. zebrina]
HHLLPLLSFILDKHLLPSANGIIREQSHHLSLAHPIRLPSIHREAYRTAELHRRTSGRPVSVNRTPMPLGDDAREAAGRGEVRAPLLRHASQRKDAAFWSKQWNQWQQELDGRRTPLEALLLFLLTAYTHTHIQIILHVSSVM